MLDFTRLDKVRRQRPLIHCVSNIVTANDCANLALAVGASPMMAQAPEGKPCSGVRGGQKASTDFPQQADARLPTLHGKGKTLFRTLFSPCKF